MSTRDKKLLIILAGVAVLALTYFFVFSPQADKRDQLENENMNLKSQYNELSTLAAKADQYTQKTEDMSAEMEAVYNNFPSYLQIENGIMDAVEIEKSTNTHISELTVGSPVAVDVTAPADGTDGSTDSTDSSQSTDAADSSTTDNASADGTGTETGSTTTASSSVTGYQLYDVSTVMAFTSEYHGLKAMLGEVIGSSDKKTVSTLNVSFDDSTGKLTGELLVDSYFLYGLDKPYEAPYIPSVPHGTDNLFGTTN